MRCLNRVAPWCASFVSLSTAAFVLGACSSPTRSAPNDVARAEPTAAHATAARSHADLEAQSSATTPAPTPAPIDKDAELAAIRAVLDAQQAAWNRGDIDTYMSAGYWQSPQLVFLSGGTITRGYEPVLKRYKARYQGEGKEMGRLAFSETEVELWSHDVALARGRWDLSMSDGKTIGGRYSLAIAKLAEGWRIVQDHSSID